MEKRKTAKREYTLNRFWGKILQFLARKSPFMPGRFRTRLQSWRGVKFTDPASVFIGENVYFDDIYPELITIGKNVRITEGTKILSHFLDTTSPPFNFYQGEVFIGNDVFIGMNVIISKPVRIGDGAVIGANAVVIEDIPENTIVGGIPAKPIGKREPRIK